MFTTYVFPVEKFFFIFMGRIDQTTQYGIFQFSIFLQKRVQFFEEEEMIMHEGVVQFKCFIFLFENI